MAVEISGYRWADSADSWVHTYLLTPVEQILSTLPKKCRVFDLGCGNGALPGWLAQRGYDVTGVDPSTEGISVAHKYFPDLDLHLGSSDDDLATIYGQFPIVISLEVICVVHSPATFARCAYELLKPGGTAIISTPYHGYWKNLAIAVTGKFDRHFRPLVNVGEGGFTKYWSMATLGKLLTDTGFTDISFVRVGRIPPLAKSMIAIAKKPPEA